MAIPYVELHRAGHEDERGYTKKVGQHPIRFRRTLAVGYPAGFELHMPKESFLKKLWTLLRPIRSRDDMDHLMRRAVGVGVWNADVSVLFHKDAREPVDTLVARNFMAPSFLERFSRIHKGHVVLRTEERDIAVQHESHRKVAVRRVSFGGRQQRYQIGRHLHSDTLT